MANIKAGTPITVVLTEQFTGQWISLVIASVWQDKKTATTQLYFNTPEIGLIDTELGRGVTLKPGFILSQRNGQGWVLIGDFVRDQGIYYLRNLAVGVHTDE